LEYSYLVSLEIVSNAKNFINKMKDYRTILTILRRNKYTNLSIEINEEKEYIKYSDKIHKDFITAQIRISII